MIQVDDLHQIYLEQSGNPEGIPVLFLHGGPGAGLNPIYRRLFDPEVYRIIGFDQRGCGRSRPYAETKQNNTQALLQDIEQIRCHLGIEKWLVTGGSWGSTLALLYAIEHPARVDGLILRGIFLARQQDYEWFLEAHGGAAQLFPDYYQGFIEPVKDSLESKSLTQAYWEALTSKSEITQTNAARAWSLWEERIAKLNHQTSSEELGHVRERLCIAKLECHYMLNHCFVEQDFILQNLAKIGDIPTTIVHGRYDIVCKVENAFTLHQSLANSQLLIVPLAGHSTSEVPIAEALTKASTAMAKFIRETRK